MFKIVVGRARADDAVQSNPWGLCAKRLGYPAAEFSVNNVVRRAVLHVVWDSVLNHHRQRRTRCSK